MAKPPKKPTEDDQLSSIDLSAPWNARLGSEPRNIARSYPVNSVSQSGRFLRSKDLMNFVNVRSDLHALYVQETQRTRRLAMCLAAPLLALACLIPVFAPEGREVISYWLGIALFVFAAGAMGYSGIRYTSEKRQLELSKDNHDA